MNMNNFYFFSFPFPLQNIVIDNTKHNTNKISACSKEKKKNIEKE